jgi:hypothetical protein
VLPEPGLRSRAMPPRSGQNLRKIAEIGKNFIEFLSALVYLKLKRAIA